MAYTKKTAGKNTKRGTTNTKTQKVCVQVEIKQDTNTRTSKSGTGARFWKKKGKTEPKKEKPKKESPKVSKAYKAYEKSAKEAERNPAGIGGKRKTE